MRRPLLGLGIATMALLALDPAMATGLAHATLPTEAISAPMALRPVSIAVAAPESPPMHPLALLGGEPVPWHHPLAGPRELPNKADRRFGAVRSGMRPECGGGHCGVDVGRERGTIVHAAVGGTVAKLVGSADRKGGRYVRLVHDGGFATYYMHLDRVRSDLEVGDWVASGEPLGTVGSSGIQNSPPHLHFAIAIIDASGEHYIDPEPLLRTATVLAAPVEVAELVADEPEMAAVGPPEPEREPAPLATDSSDPLRGDDAPPGG